jgi:hypothetical protein
MGAAGVDVVACTTVQLSPAVIPDRPHHGCVLDDDDGPALIGGGEARNDQGGRLMANPPSNFQKYARTVFVRDILPIIPAGATIKEGSTVNPKMLGKIPGKWLENIGAWIGFGGWQTHRANHVDMDLWQNYWQPQTETAIAIGINLRIYHVFDLDIDKEAVAKTAECEITMMMGASPVVRLRYGSSRRVLFYESDQHTPPIRKHRLTFKDKDGDQGIIEFLANGQQVVIEGPHAKGQMHYWRDGIGLLEGRQKLSENLITGKQVEACFKRLDDWVVEEGGQKVKLNLPTSSDNAAAVSITSLTSPHRATDDELLKRAIEHIDINDDQLAGYDYWLVVLRAIKTACGGDQTFYDEVVWPWLQKNPANNDEIEMWGHWNSFHDSQVGAEFVYRLASTFGFSEGVNKLVEEMFDGLAEDAPDIGGAQGDPGGGSSSVGGAGSMGSGPIPFNDTHHAIANNFTALYGTEWRYNVDAKRWYRFRAGIWEPCDTIIDLIGRMTYQLSQQILSTVNGPQGANRSRSLESTGTVMSVRNLLQGREGMVAREEDFDAHPRLLNTPDGVIDLKTGAISDHNSALLLRQITLVTPDFNAVFDNDYERLCPRFFSVLRNIAAGRPWVIPAIRAMYAYCLTREIRHHSLFFIQGPPGVGKTQLLQILFELLHTYGFLLGESFLSKNGGETKRFDIADIIAKRMLFLDETMLGMSWDETRMSAMSSGKMLSAELKFGAARALQEHWQDLHLWQPQATFRSGRGWRAHKPYAAARSRWGELQGRCDQGDQQLRHDHRGRGRRGYHGMGARGLRR